MRRTAYVPLLLVALVAAGALSACGGTRTVIRESCPDARVTEVFSHRDTVEVSPDTTIIITTVDSVRIECGGPGVPGIDGRAFAPDSLRRLPPPDTTLLEPGAAP